MAKSDKGDKGADDKGKLRRPRKVTKSPFGIQVKLEHEPGSGVEDSGVEDDVVCWRDVSVVDEVLTSTSACEKWIKAHSDIFTDQVVRIIQIKCERTLTVKMNPTVLFA